MRSTRPKNISSIRNGLASTPPIPPIAPMSYPFTKIPTNSFTIKTPSKLPANTKRQWTKKVSGKWSYFRSLTKSWVGDWNVKQSVTYHVVQIECHPRYDDVGYLCYEIGCNVLYMVRKEPSSVDDLTFSTCLRLKE